MKHTGSHTIIVDSFDNIFCKFIETDHNTYECSKCGNVIQTDKDGIEPYMIPCRSPLVSNNIPKSISSFAKSIPNLAQDVCSETEIEQRYNICSGCDYFKHNSCEKCGCNIVKDRNYLNKIAVKKEQCPIGLWKEIVN